MKQGASRLQQNVIVQVKKKFSVSCVPLTGVFMLGLLFDPEEGSGIFLRNV
jgi:DUF971 family protein